MLQEKWMGPQEKGWCYLRPEVKWTLSISNIKSWEEILTGDSINTMPSLFKCESLQMMVSLADTKICCCFSKTESMIGITWVISYRKNFFFQKIKSLILCITSDFLTLHSVHLSNVLYMLQLSRWYFLPSLLRKKMTAVPSTRHCHLYALD